MEIEFAHCMIYSGGALVALIVASILAAIAIM